MRNGLPIAAGYFAVSFSLGIVMRNAGLTPLDGLIMSLLNNTSAGEAAAVGIIASNGSYLEMAASQLVINIRYFLMSAALTVCLDPDLSLAKRIQRDKSLPNGKWDLGQRGRSHTSSTRL